ncbi:DUF2254 family protein [Nocardia sp. NPDC059180]|uniref:DUF2254 family protein n=1 Tax=Nocardia sp. NPDC059180 TaxID=3346761 RepID=UPI00369A4FA4
MSRRSARSRSGPYPRRSLRAANAQLLCAAAGVGLGIAMPRIPGGPRAPAPQVVDLLFTAGLGLLGAVALIFSLLFLVLQWVATTFTPRLTLFRDAPIVWRTFAFAIGLVSFCVTAALAIGNDHDVSVAVPVTAMSLMLIMLWILRTLQLRAFAAIQLVPALKSIAARGRAVLGELEVRSDRAPPARPVPPHRNTISWPDPPTVLQRLDTDQLLDLAHAADAVLVLRAAPGATLRRGMPVADVYGAVLTADTVLTALVVGNERGFDQDPLLAFRLLADIALRALSPAVNDPATAVQALDEIGDLLMQVAAAPLMPLWLADPDGDPRVLVPLPDWDTFLRVAVDDIVFASSSPMVLRHVRDVLERVADHADPERRSHLAPRLSWVAEEMQNRFPQVAFTTAASDVS